MSNPTDWPPTNNYPAPAISPGFQEQLSSIGGKVDDRPMLRLIWGMSPEATVFWKGQRRLRYIYKVVQDFKGWRSTSYNPDGTIKEIKFFPPSATPPAEEGALIVEKILDVRDIGIPRWFIEQIMPAAILSQDWEEVRRDFNSDTKELEDCLGPIPSKGDYEEAFYMIADHSACCKGINFVPFCYGEYRPPASYDITYVRYLMTQLNKEPYRYAWDQMPPPEVVAQDLRDRKTAQLHALLKKKEEQDYAIRNSIAPHALFGGGHFDIGAAFARAKKF